MDVLRSSLNVIFKEQNPINIIYNYFYPDGRDKDNHREINEKKFTNLYMLQEGQYSRDEIVNIHEIVKQDMDYTGQSGVQNKSVFNLLTKFNEDVLEDLGWNVQCKYRHLLRWRMASHKLDQDLFIASFLAYKDNLIVRDRNIFDWDVVIKSNNVRLHSMLSKGMAENHFHLKGSAPYFYFCWVSLMNDVKGRKKQFEKIGIKANRLEADSDGVNDLEKLVTIAAIIRAILFYTINNNLNFYEDELNECLKNLDKIVKENGEINESEISLARNDIQNQISVLKQITGKEFEYKHQKKIVDYAITNKLNTEDRTTRFLSGERSLMYQCFKRLYLKDKSFVKYADLFYAYIIIKNKFRAELVQTNERVGFANFAEYQDRKSILLDKDPILKESIESTAILSSIKSQNIVSLEARVIPKYKSYENASLIKTTDENIVAEIRSDKNNKWMKNSEDSFDLTREILNGKSHTSIKTEDDIKDKFFYVFHFPKGKDKGRNKGDLYNSLRCRHYVARKELKKNATAIYVMRERYQEVSKRMLGIDACANELFERPEVFAQSFRFLKDHLPSEKPVEELTDIPRVRATYHVGEDFFDIADGLRAIEEAVTFLNLTHGDRLGHAIALGTDVKAWYGHKRKRTVLSKQDILDNVAWMITKIKEFNIKDGVMAIQRLEPIFNKYFLDIYGQADIFNNNSYNNINISSDIYWHAWKLRGDNPEYYFSDDIKLGLTYWDRCALRHDVDDNIRENVVIRQLYKSYHYDPKVKKKGNEKEEFKVEEYMVNILVEIQKKMQIDIRKRGIAIETNPTSNYLISNFRRYDKHPLLNFYNLGLTIDEDRADECPQLFVSINTDDQGVFGTLLENEYALMAIALEKSKDCYGECKYNQSMIYDWLDRIRLMGIEQSFKK